IVPHDSPADSGFLALAFTNGVSTGSQQFGGLPAGTYDARFYLSGTYTILGSATFGVGGLTTDHPEYGEGDPITVNWSGTPGNVDDWIAIVHANSPPDSGFVDLIFTNGMSSGTNIFNGITTDGDYEVRSYVGGSYTIIASTAFTVNGITPPPPPPTDFHLDQP